MSDSRVLVPGLWSDIFGNRESQGDAYLKTGIVTASGESVDDGNPLPTSNQLIDEFGNTARMLGDNLFIGAPVVLSSEHHEIHCGDSYEATNNTTLGNGGTAEFLIVVPNESGVDQSLKLYHFLVLLESQSEVSVTLFEDANSSGGIGITSFNRNRNSSLDDSLDISRNPTTISDGVPIWGPWRVGSGRNLAGVSNRNREIILKNNTRYLLRVTNETNAENNINTEFDYYVHPGV